MADPVQPQIEPTPSWYTGKDTLGAVQSALTGSGATPEQIAFRKKLMPTTDQGGIDWKQLGKDTAVNAATQLPLMLAPEAGIPARAAMSIGSGTIADKVLNDDGWLGSLLRGVSNTATSMAIPGALENKISYKAPTIQGTGVSAPILKALSLINPANWSTAPRMMVRQGASQAVPANMGNIGKDLLLRIPGIPQSMRLGIAGMPADVLEQVLRNATGFGANEAINEQQDQSSSK